MRYQGIKVTVITGFLGAGKTTLIRHLLAQAPAYERWAVLVNEFGDIGLDGALLSDTGVAIKEVPGGCACCTTSVAFAQGLNQLIREQNPDRILIEPSGLGHPKQIIESLRARQYQEVLLVTGVFCVLDSRNLFDERYTQHAIFNDQIDCADIVVASHVASYSSEDVERLREYCQSRSISSQRVVISDSMSLLIADLDPRLVINTVQKIHTDYPEKVSQRHSLISNGHSHSVPHHKANKATTSEYYVKQQDGMKVIGWQWPSKIVFNEMNLRTKLETVIGLDDVYRVKGVFALGEGQALFVNGSHGQLSMKLSVWYQESCYEVIGLDSGNWQQVILNSAAKIH